MENACRAFIFWENKILLCKQKKPCRNFWTLPGGCVERGETLEECVEREVFEETGIELKIDQMLFVRELINASRHRIEFYFLMKEPANQEVFKRIKPCNEIGEVAFWKIEDLKTVILKPDCLPRLVQEILNKYGTFPRYLGNIS